MFDTTFWQYIDAALRWIGVSAVTLLVVLLLCWALGPRLDARADRRNHRTLRDPAMHTIHHYTQQPPAGPDVTYGTVHVSGYTLDARQTTHGVCYDTEDGGWWKWASPHTAATFTPIDGSDLDQPINHWPLTANERHDRARQQKREARS